MQAFFVFLIRLYFSFSETEKLISSFVCILHTLFEIGANKEVLCTECGAVDSFCTKKHGCKARVFSRGDNAEMHPCVWKTKKAA